MASKKKLKRGIKKLKKSLKEERAYRVMLDWQNDRLLEMFNAEFARNEELDDHSQDAVIYNIHQAPRPN